MCSYVHMCSSIDSIPSGVRRVYYAKQKHPGCKKVRGQSEAALQIGSYVRPKSLISVEAKKLLIKNLLE